MPEGSGVREIQRAVEEEEQWRTDKESWGSGNKSDGSQVKHSRRGQKEPAGACGYYVGERGGPGERAVRAGGSRESGHNCGRKKESLQPGLPGPPLHRASCVWRSIRSLAKPPACVRRTWRERVSWWSLEPSPCCSQRWSLPQPYCPSVPWLTGASEPWEGLGHPWTSWPWGAKDAE